MTARVLLVLITTLMGSGAFAASSGAGGETERQQFLSWYDGYFNHHVWGLGLQWGPYNGTFVHCGAQRVPVRAVYDTHTSRTPPTATQAKEYVSTVNVALVRSLQTQGLRCVVSKDPP